MERVPTAGGGMAAPLFDERGGRSMSLTESDDSSIPPDPVQDSAAGIAGMAHDLRAPLAAIHAATELLAQDLDCLDETQIRQMVLTIHRSIRRFEQLTDNLQSLIAVRAGRLTVNRAPLNLRELVEECAGAAGPLLAAKAQQWAIQQASPLPLVLADRHLIDRVCMNLLMNASKFAAPGTLIEGVLTQVGDCVRVAIQDRGPGLPPGDVARLFDPFYQAPNPVPSGGVGLGLAIVRALVEAQGGRVGAENRRGGGARVWLEFPVVRESG
jgi:two-component system sensor histidine kinase KdpD